MNNKEYTSTQLVTLHQELYDILSKIIHICEKYEISYFAIGGTLIGAAYDHSILPWDDDVDVGMTRDNYDRFLEVAQQELGNDYFLSCIKTDPHTPFFYAKVKKNNTLFIEEKTKSIKMHQGIFVDVFPFDNVPNNLMMRGIQRKFVNFLKTCLMGKEVWVWKRFRKCQIEQPLDRSLVSSFVCWLFVLLLPKDFIYRIMLYLMTLFNKTKTQYVGLVVTDVDYFKKDAVTNLQEVQFGPLMIKSIIGVNNYMEYNSLHRYTEEETQNIELHRPLTLKFSK